jgi:hypothetical protein
MRQQKTHIWWSNPAGSAEDDSSIMTRFFFLWPPYPYIVYCNQFLLSVGKSLNQSFFVEKSQSLCSVGCPFLPHLVRDHHWAWVTVLGLHQESACRLPGNVGEMTSKKGTWHIFNSCWCRHNRDSAGKHSYSELNGQSLAHLTDSPWDESNWSNQYFVLTNHCTTFLEDSASHCRQMFVFTAQAVFHHEIHESNAQSCIYSPTA